MKKAQQSVHPVDRYGLRLEEVEQEVTPTETTQYQVVKRDGNLEAFDPSKIRAAISKAYSAERLKPQEEVIEKIVQSIEIELKQRGSLEIEEIQNMVETGLMGSNPYLAKRYILYRDYRDVERNRRTKLKQVLDGIVEVESNDVTNSNANMSAHTPAGQMMTFAAEISKDYTTKYILSPRYTQAHREGAIHIHDLDYYATKTTTCLQYDLNELFENGFKTKNGSVRTPQSIQSYATLATIIFQTNQNEQHGGQAIPAFDFFMAPGVLKSFWKHIARNVLLFAKLGDDSAKLPSEKEIRQRMFEAAPDLELNDEVRQTVAEVAKSLGIQLDAKKIDTAIIEAIEGTQRDTHQAMEGFLHNLNTMHSRGGNQVVFSSINYGTDTSKAGRMLIRELLKATEEGLGQGEIPIFPIQIFKVKDGVNYSEADVKKASEDFEAAMRGEMEFECPNFDLLVEACRTTAHALFPNFVFLDTEFNSDPEWRADDPKRYKHEIATMGCRTRVYENINGPRTSVGRGNISFTSINMPRLAIEAKLEAASRYVDAPEEEIKIAAKRIFLNKLEEMSRFVAEQLHTRYEFQRSALALQFPFMMRNNVWKGGGTLGPKDKVGDVIKQGTLGIGFIGGHNAMVALYQKGHSESKEAWNTLYEALEVMNKVANEYKEKYGLNYSVLATPAEGLSGRFTRMDYEKFGEIPGVTDRPYYINSFHVDVTKPVNIMQKIAIEAPFHALTLGGHITYVELDGEAKKNVNVILQIVKAMHDSEVGYGSINHPVDTCKQCDYRGEIYAKCPVCGSDQIERLRRITGYLVGSTDNWNSAKQAEEHDRVKHSKQGKL